MAELKLLCCPALAFLVLAILVYCACVMAGIADSGQVLEGPEE